MNATQKFAIERDALERRALGLHLESSRMKPRS
jgi:hypothetical protein